MKGFIEKFDIISDVSLVTFNNFSSDTALMAKLFDDILKCGINVDMISQTVPRGSNTNISFTVPENDLPKLISLTKEYKEKNIVLDISNGYSKLWFYAEKMRRTPGVAAFVFGILSKYNIGVKLITTSEVDISCLVDSIQIEECFDKIKAEL